MKVTETKLKGCFIIEPTIFGDERGYFLESFNRQKFNELIGVEIEFVQDNESYSTKGVLRGLHFQKGDFAQAKLVRVSQGQPRANFACFLILDAFSNDSMALVYCFKSK